jgi:hypothetical protein
MDQRIECQDDGGVTVVRFLDSQLLETHDFDATYRELLEVAEVEARKEVVLDLSLRGYVRLDIPQLTPPAAGRYMVRT